MPTVLGVLGPPSGKNESHRSLFPSKFGGAPSWLNPEHVPTRIPCPKCEGSMSFLFQLYAWLDEDRRMLYFFACRKCKDQFRALRSVVRLSDKYYLDDECQTSNDARIQYSESHYPTPPWTSDAESWNEKKIDTIDEYTDAEASSDDEEEDIQEEDTEYEKGLYKDYLEKQTDVKGEDESDFDYDDIDDVCKTDESFQKFQKAFQRNTNQFVRYYPEAPKQPFWVSDNRQLTTPPQKCSCGSARRLEFQVLPSLMSLEEDVDLEYGIVCVYTCDADCMPPLSDDFGAYADEFVYVQKEDF